MNKGADLNPLADIKEPDSFRSVQLMTAGTQHIDLTLIYIDRYLSKCLNCIRMEQHTMLFRDGTDLFDRFDGTDLIVGEHNGNQDRIRANRRFQLIQLHKSVLIHIQIRHFIAAFLEIFPGMKNRMMLNLRRDNMLSFLCIRFRRCLQCPVVGFRSACRKIDLIGSSSEHLCNAFSLLIDLLFVTGCKAVHT